MKCIIEKCRNIAEYNYKYNSTPKYCVKHKNNQMIYKTYMCICIIL